MDSRMWQTTQNLFHTFIIHKTTDNIAMWVIRHSIVHWPCSRIQTLLVILEDSKSTSGGILFLEVEHSSLYIGMCKKQTAVSHSSTESEIIPLDAGFSMKGLPASDLRDTVVQVLRSLQINMKPSIIASGNGSEISQVRQSNKREHPLAAGNGSVCNVHPLSQMDHVSSKAQYSQGDSKLYIFEDNEAVIKMIIKGRSLPWDMWQEPTELLLIVRSNQFWSEDPNQIRWHQESTRWHSNQKVVSPKTNGTTCFVCWTSWMYPRSPAAISNIFSDFSKNPKPMSKRGEEQNFGEGSAMAKPKQMSPVQAKAKPRNLVSQASHSSSRWSEKEVTLMQHWATLKFRRKHWDEWLVLTIAPGNVERMSVTRVPMSSILKWQHKKMFRAHFERDGCFVQR